MQLIGLLAAAAVSVVSAQNATTASASASAGGAASASAPAASSGAAAPATSASGAAAAPAATTATAAGGNPLCTTANGGGITIITPATGVTETAGASFSITWSIYGSDSAFDAAQINFSLLDATNSNNAVAIAPLVFSKPPTVSDLQASTSIPATTKQVTKYAIRSEYKDAGSWKYCFSPPFTVSGLGAPVATTNPATAPVVVTTTGAQPTATGAATVSKVVVTTSGSVGMQGVAAAGFAVVAAALTL